MEKDIRKRLRKDINCELSIEQLKILYEIDKKNSINLFNYRNKRNNYEDFCKMFGKDVVANIPAEINENTLYYVGDLKVDKIMPTNNIKYIYGNIYYRLHEVYNLNKLEIVTKNAYFNWITNSNGLENLTEIGRSAHFQKLISAKGLEKLTKIGKSAFFKKLKSAEGLNNLIEIGGNANFKMLTDSKGLNNLTKIGRDAIFLRLTNAQYLNKLEYIGSDAWFYSLKDSKGLNNLVRIGKCAIFYSLENVNGLKNLKQVGPIVIDNIEYVAFNMNQLNVTTEIYLNDLTIDKELPTHNLRYIYGSLYYQLDKIYNLENLEIIDGNAIFKNLLSAEGLNCLTYIKESVYFEKLVNLKGLENLKFIGKKEYFGGVTFATLRMFDKLQINYELDKKYLDNTLNNILYDLLFNSYIVINDDANVYNDLTDAFYYKNGVTTIANNNVKREITTVAFEYDGKFLYIKKDDLYAKDVVNTLLEKGAKIVSIITSIDGKECKGAYNINDIEKIYFNHSDILDNNHQKKIGSL